MIGAILIFGAMGTNRRDIQPKPGAGEGLLEMTLEPSLKGQVGFNQVKKEDNHGGGRLAQG